jgi:nitrite reductase/ring-hydroxylating ferredoxin subunit
VLAGKVRSHGFRRFFGRLSADAPRHPPLTGGVWGASTAAVVHPNAAQTLLVVPGGYEYLCEADLAEGAMRRVKVGEYGVCVVNAAGEYFAIEDACNHSGASLARGVLTGHVVSCYLHRFDFDVRDGRLLTKPRLCEDQQRFPLVRVGTGLYGDLRGR